MYRKPLHAIAGLCAALLFHASALAADASKTYVLEPKRTLDAIDRVEVRLDVEGNLKVADASADAGKHTKLPMTASAALTYDEKTLESSRAADAILRSVRHYDKAGAAIRVADEQFRSELRPERRLIAVEVAGSAGTLFSPRGTLSRDELDVIDALANSLVVDRLLPDRAVAISETWKPTDATIAVFCGLDEVKRNDVRCSLAESSATSLTVDMAGKVEGTVGGLASKIELKAKYRFSIEWARITGLSLALREDREPGLAGPGLAATAKLQMKITPGQESTNLVASALTDVSLKPTNELLQVTYIPPSPEWEVDCDRRWFTLREERSSAVFRMVQEGGVLAQCNVGTAKQLKSKEEATLAKFQDVVHETLGKNFGEFLNATEAKADDGARMFRVEVQGVVSAVPVHWIYYQLVDSSGRQLVVAFTLEASQVEAFKEADRALVRSLRMRVPEVAEREKR
jgi:hypothetical protein